jgi:hypothetical protein
MPLFTHGAIHERRRGNSPSSGDGFLPPPDGAAFCRRDRAGTLARCKGTGGWRGRAGLSGAAIPGRGGGSGPSRSATPTPSKSATCTGRSCSPPPTPGAQRPRWRRNGFARRTRSSTCARSTPPRPPENVAGLLAGQNVVLDCTDNFRAKFLLHDACWLAGIPLVQAAIYQTEGWLQVFRRDAGAGCQRCTYPDIPEEGCTGTCAQVGVLGVVPGVLGTMQASETLKLLLGLDGVADQAMIMLDLQSLLFTAISRDRNSSCPLCGDAPRITGIKAGEYTSDPAWVLDLEKLGTTGLAGYTPRGRAHAGRAPKRSAGRARPAQLLFDKSRRSARPAARTTLPAAVRPRDALAQRRRRATPPGPRRFLLAAPGRGRFARTRRGESPPFPICTQGELDEPGLRQLFHDLEQHAEVLSVNAKATATRDHRRGTAFNRGWPCPAVASRRHGLASALPARRGRMDRHPDGTSRGLAYRAHADRARCTTGIADLIERAPRMCGAGFRGTKPAPEILSDDRDLDPPP